MGKYADLINWKHLSVFTAVVVVIGIIAYFILSHEDVGFHKARLFWSIVFLIAGAIIVYLADTIDNENIKKILKIGYLPLVLGYALFAAELIIFITAFAINEPFDLADYLQALMIAVTGLIGAATIYFAMVGARKSDVEKEDVKIEANRGEISKVHEEYARRISDLEKEIEALKKS